MSYLIPGNQKHLTQEDREYIEQELNNGSSFKDIAKFLCKDPTTISKEVRKHRYVDWYRKGTFYNAKNFCTRRYRCQKTNVCDKIILCGIKCTSCPSCNLHCPDFDKERCGRLDKAPYVCNGCDKQISKCTVPVKYKYSAIRSDREYRKELSDSRTGITLTKSELIKISCFVQPLIAMGQSPYQIITNHPELGISVRTLYQYIEDEILLSRNIDLKRKVKFKPRKVHKSQIKEREVFIGRMYSDFKELNLDAWVEMDTVLSAKGSQKTILTFYFKREKLFLAYLLNRCTKGAVKAVFDRLENKLGTYDFLLLFEHLLTDRGKEFAAPEALETGTQGFQRTSIYYCDPMRSNQKGGVENVHTKLREVLPKGTIFSFLTQWDLNLIVNHINSTPRKSLNGRTPYDVALETFGEDILKKLQLKRIAPDEVCLSPKLIKYNR